MFIFYQIKGVIKGENMMIKKSGTRMRSFITKRYKNSAYFNPFKPLGSKCPKLFG